MLLADDDPAYRAAFESSMQALGHDLIAVDRGSELLGELERSAPDIIFIDVLMPGGGAISLLHEILQRPHAPPVVVITGNAAILASPIVADGLQLAAARVSKLMSIDDLDTLITATTTPRDTV